MTTPDPATCDSCPADANGLDVHDDPTCGYAPCPPVNEFSLAIDIAADGTTTVAYTPPTRERCGRCGQVPEGSAHIGTTRYCHGDERPSCYMLASYERSTDRRTPAVRDALHLVGLDLPREA